MHTRTHTQKRERQTERLGKREHRTAMTVSDGFNHATHMARERHREPGK